MTEKVKEMASTLREVMLQVGASVDEVLDVILDHEKRLAALEKRPRSIREELDRLEEQIKAIGDARKRKRARQDFTRLCAVLDVPLASVGHG